MSICCHGSTPIYDLADSADQKRHHRIFDLPSPWTLGCKYSERYFLCGCRRALASPSDLNILTLTRFRRSRFMFFRPLHSSLYVIVFEWGICYGHARVNIPEMKPFLHGALRRLLSCRRLDFVFLFRWGLFRASFFCQTHDSPIISLAKSMPCFSSGKALTFIVQWVFFIYLLIVSSTVDQEIPRICLSRIDWCRIQKVNYLATIKKDWVLSGCTIWGGVYFRIRRYIYIAC